MENKIQKIKILCVVLTLTLGLAGSISATSIDDSSVVNLQTITPCGNSRCDANDGENSTTCPGDCGCNSNGLCEVERGEDAGNCAIDCLTTRQGGGGAILPTVYNLSVFNITSNSIEISWETAEPAACQLAWGTSTEYGDGIVSERASKLRHNTGLTGLLSGTIYYFKIACSDDFGNQAQSQDQRFVTLLPIDFTPPANVSNLEITLKDLTATLQWINPNDADFKGVVIVKSTSFYPDNPWQKEQVYTGPGSFFIDNDLKTGVTYYYSVFAYDYNGNYSSGSIISTTPKGIVILPLVPEPDLPKKIHDLDFADFVFAREGTQIIPEGSIIKAEQGQVVTVLTDKIKLPVGYKIILDAESNTSFLSLDRVKSTYETTITLHSPGEYPFSIIIINETTKKAVKVFSGTFSVRTRQITEEPFLNWLFLVIIYAVTILLVLFTVFALLRYAGYVKINLRKR